MTVPTSLRLDENLKARLTQRAENEGIPTATLAQRLIDEGLRMASHPGVVFRGGPAGRRAALMRGPDVAEVVGVVRHLDASGEERIVEAAAWLEIPVFAVRAAIDYYSAFSDEIDAELERRAVVAREAKARYDRQQRLLS